MMAFHVRDQDTDRVVRELAALTGGTLTETIRRACETELASLQGPGDRERRLAEMRTIQDELARYPDTGVAIGKTFFDALNDE